jgi:hypothetical protein
MTIKGGTAHKNPDMNGGTVDFSDKIAISLNFTAEHAATTERDRKGIRKFSTP